MTALEFVQLAYQEATGQVFSGVWGDVNASRMLSYGNMHINTWSLEPDVDWESLYNPGLACGTVPAGTPSQPQTITLPTTILKVSNHAHDFVYVLDSSGNIISQWTSVPAWQLKYFNGAPGYVAVLGNSTAGFRLYFSQPFSTTSPEYGNTIYVPSFTIPTPMALSTDPVPVDDPNWLVFMAAQEWAQPDVTLVQNVPSLISKATDRMNAMMMMNQRIRSVSQESVSEGAARGDTWGWME